ncbi:MAG: glycosyltransferase family 2 protein [Candidatus Daviesbacteria bacterium]|nr:MAG: glycosyltransferase family 2 protein [Candidatus Daviesbacteria bacterium]
MKVTIAIPNYNGEELLPKNLPNILAAGADEVLVNDDASKDESIKIIQENFPQVKLLINQQNKGFVSSVNKLFNEASGEIVVLLNNDVLVDKNFLKPLLKHFRDSKIFAVNCHEEGQGWGKSCWKNGYYEFVKTEEDSRMHQSAWASGGSAAFNKKIWQSLGGLDRLFAPFYWEDIDLSFRALKTGFNILWEPKSLVYHQHGTTIGKTHSSKFVAKVQERNQLLFIWKNITDKNLLTEHRINLIKRLLGGLGIGYWIPFGWAFIKKGEIKKTTGGTRSDLEVINYAD